ncbi:pectate lyase superfamily protein-domain-containing protein [Diplogelasinospora grovesii]|uniref:Pectate lyase superfamily protein-domain-containing protein n=1 Tax=Diplogelasinospora grovesii TaxID=303347 RepID=A0AAN6S2E0_9PEZI|nr:pectate lyase superfamily protein-domain-containing protein [Diplogelasinospora grovesii]
MAAFHQALSVTRVVFQATLSAFILFLFLTVSPHYAAAEQLHGLSARNGTTTPSSDAEAIVAAAQAAMAQANALIMKHPRPNRYKALGSADMEAAKQPAAPLSLDGYSGASSANMNSTTVSRRALNDTATTPSQRGLSYTVPSEVAAAARAVADATAAAVDKTLTADSYGTIVEELKAKFKAKTNDTNRMPQRMQSYSGLMGGVIAPGHGHELATTGTTDNSTMERRQSDDKDNEKTFWMETLTQHGASPYASSQDYKVWRNVKNYGAVGNGVADDTAAIQKAISDGRGDGAALAATVYFPSGTYLVSSPITHVAHTEMIGNPLALPTIVAAASFVGLGVITSEAFTKAQAEWYLNSDSQQRSARNLIVDAGRGCSLENMRFYMAYAAETTQMGVFVENGQGGFLGDLFFVGGRFGMLVGQQRFAADGLYFSKCQTAMQMVWDWGLSLQNIVVSDCGTGVDIVDSFAVSVPATTASSATAAGTNGTLVGRRNANQGLAGSDSLWSRLPHRRNESSVPSGEDGTAASASVSGAGSFSLVDMRMVNTKVAINASLSSDDATSLLVLNSAFDNVATAIHNSASGGAHLLTGVSSISAWAFGKVYDDTATTTGSFKTVHGETIASSKRNTSLTVSDYPSNAAPQPFFFHRRRPSYASLDTRATQVIDVKAFGAKGDGVSDDTGILNKILDMAANMSAITYFPHGAYVIGDTLNIPVGSRVVGQASAQIVVTGAFADDAKQPRAAVRVGRRLPGGDVGAVEIQGLTFATRGKTDGAVLMEWNVREASQGSVGLWDTQFRVGDDKDGHGPATTAAALLLHLRPGSSAYLENVDLGPNMATSGGGGAVSARGLLIESKGPTWLWGTSSENSAVYQYGLSRAENLVAGQLCTSGTTSSSLAVEAQNLVDIAPFAGDPVPGSGTKQLPGVRISNSQGIQILSAGDLSSSASSPSVFDIEQSSRITIHNANSAAADDASGGSIVTQLDEGSSSSKSSKRQDTDTTTTAAYNIHSFLSLADVTIAAANYTPYALWTQADMDATNATDTCKAVLMATINCFNVTLKWRGQPMYHGSLPNADMTAAVCDPTCKASLAGYISRVERICGSWTFSSGASPTLQANYIYYGWNETCSKDTTGSHCNAVIDALTPVSSLDQMPQKELCSYCYTTRLLMMQASPYSVYNQVSFYERALKLAVSKCGISAPTAPQAPPEPTVSTTPVCVSGRRYTAAAGDTCNSIAQAHGVSSAGLLNANKNLAAVVNCTSIAAGMDLCLPLGCNTYVLQDGDTSCGAVAFAHGITGDDLQRYNSWIDYDCENLQTVRPILGSVICLTAAGGTFVPPGNSTTGSGNGNGGTGQNAGGTGYSDTLAAPPQQQQQGATVAVAARTTLNCGIWHVAQAGDTCEGLQVANGMAQELLLETNPSLRGPDCTAMLVPGTAYCVSPLQTWETVVSFPYHSMGCYLQSNTSVRVLWDYFTRDDIAMTVEACAAECLLPGYRFFGMLNGDECYCDNKLYAGSARRPPTECKVGCVGNTTESCGGSEASNLMSVWGWPTTVVIG